jgi:hypothetical protein
MGHVVRFFGIVSLCGFSHAADVHVSPTGADEAPGTASAPVRTLEQARARAQSLRRTHTTRDRFHPSAPGIHTVRKTVAFNREDSGTAEAPLNILAWRDPSAPDARPLLVGGAIVSGWKKRSSTDAQTSTRPI